MAPAGRLARRVVAARRGGSAYVGTLAGRVLRLDVRTGGVRWSAEAAGDVKASLALSGPNVVVGDYAGHVTAFRRSDGRIAWQRESPGGACAGPGASTPVAYGRVFIGNVNGRVIALDEDTGEVAWVRVLDDYVYSSAAVADRRDRRQRPARAPGRRHRAPALEVRRGRAHLGLGLGDRRRGVRLDPGEGPARRRTVALDLRTGRPLWTFPDGRYSPAVAVRGLLVLTGVRTLARAR